MRKLPILMYHNVTADSTKSVGLTISTAMLEQQFQYLVARGYKTVHFKEWKEPLKTPFFAQMKKEGMLFALRIGNKVNKSLTSKPYELNRLDVKGEEPLWKFKLKLRFGKLF